MHVDYVFLQNFNYVCSEERVFSHVGCLFLLVFDEISVGFFEAGASLTVKVEQGRK